MENTGESFPIPIPRGTPYSFSFPHPSHPSHPCHHHYHHHHPLTSTLLFYSHARPRHHTDIPHPTSPSLSATLRIRVTFSPWPPRTSQVLRHSLLVAILHLAPPHPSSLSLGRASWVLRLGSLLALVLVLVLLFHRRRVDSDAACGYHTSVTN